VDEAKTIIFSAMIGEAFGVDDRYFGQMSSWIFLFAE
jgi:hypothetical protein